MFPNDPLFAELEGIMPEWAIETLAQGAYAREYHLWEKEAKDYFFQQFQINRLSGSDTNPKLKKNRNESFVDVVKRQIKAFDIRNLENELEAIDSMRLQVNKAKHAPGVLLDHFVSIEQYWDKHAAIHSFWLKLAEEES